MPTSLNQYSIKEQAIIKRAEGNEEIGCYLYGTKRLKSTKYWKVEIPTWIKKIGNHSTTDNLKTTLGIKGLSRRNNQPKK